MGNAIGIDLGTTFSAVAVLDESGRPTIVHNLDGQNVTPSCIMVDGINVIVGEDARRQWPVDPEHVAARFKRDMGTDTKYVLGSRPYSPTELSALLLRKLKSDTEQTIGPIDQAVVTIPANFTHEAREATLAAAREAGLNISYIINEPTAAALYYAYKMRQELSGPYVVYDLGGGTFDVSIINVSGQDTNVITSLGVARLGGDDFDQALIRIVSRKFESQKGQPMPASFFSKNDAEECKKSLSKREKISARAGDVFIEVSRKEFETEISGFIAQAEMLCEAALDEAKLEVSAVKGIFLVGGSSRVPAVQASVRRLFQQEAIATVNVDEVVALGAALYSAFKSEGKHLSPVQTAAVSSIQLSEVTNFCFGTTVLSPDVHRNIQILKNEVLIRKNEKIPCSVTKTFYTIRAGQDKIDCDVTQSVSPETDPRFVKKLWKGSLPLPTGRPAGQPIHVTFGFDANNVMNCKFLDIGTGKDVAVDLRPTAATDATSAVERFLVE